MVPPVQQRSGYPDVTFRHPSQPQYQNPSQPTPSTHSSTFEEKVLQALKGLEMNTQLLHSHTQSIAKLETQIGQLATAFSRREEGKLPSQPINNPKG